MPFPGQLCPTPRLLLGPGPSDAHPRVLTAMTTPLLGHLDPQFLQFMDETKEMLRQVFQTKNNLTLPISATGMAGMETCLVNLIEPGDRVVICTAGFFGNRLVEVASRHGAEITTIERPWGQVFAAEQVREIVSKIRPKVLCMVHAETSTGAWQPVDDIGNICREFDTLFVLDTVTSLGCIPVALDAWGVDAAYSCSQKGLGCPPGLAPVSFSPKAAEVIQRRKTKPQSWYLDLTLLQKYWGEDRAYHHTAPISMIFALREGLRIVLEEGLQARWDRHQRNHQALKAGLTALSLPYLSAEGNQLPQLNVVGVPPGVNELTVRQQLLNQFNIEIGAGIGEFKGKAWRIGLMGYNSRPGVVLLALAALEQCLLSQGCKLTPGAGVAAANGAYGMA